MKPTSLTIRSYQVGFGDAFLLSFDYPDVPRHVLIDFGSTALPKEAPKNRMVEVAEDVARVCGNERLTAVVATHRHKDHISGFATNADGTASGDIIRALRPKLVLQPWTEDPDLQPDATGPGAIPVNESGKALRVASLKGMHEVAAQMLEEVKRSTFLTDEVKAQLNFLGDDNISNRSAVENLMTMGPNNYLNFGEASGLEDLLPGVETIVLGPPNADQTETVLRQRGRDENEFWHLRALTAHAAEDRGNAPESTLFDPTYMQGSGDPYPEDARWLVYRARKMQESQMLGIVRALDKAMNNTSLILLFRIGGKSLLFPGDAQIENWKYALDQPDLRKLLAEVDVYKVGHHGSLNATPKSLWQLFEKKSENPAAPKRLTSLMSTMEGKHGSIKSKTEVPRATLTEALRKESDLLSTHDVPATELCVVKTIDF
jgi:hypothetical protein